MNAHGTLASAARDLLDARRRNKQAVGYRLDLWSNLDASLPRFGTPVRLDACPIGLFRTEDGTLCVKTEYRNDDGRICAYIVASGEFFAGPAPQSPASQRGTLVVPVKLGEVAP